MDEEGEFKKRFDAKAISGQDVEWQMVALKYVHDVIDEFKKEFPKKKEEARVGGDNEEYNEEYYDVDEMDAFKKRWFGES